METKNILNTIKQLLKNKKIRYPLLAKSIGLSESGLKKMMTGNDLSLERLKKICDVIDISVVDLITLSDSTEIKNIEFTNIQNEFLLKNSLALKIFWLITIEHKSPSTICKSEKITTLDFQKIISKLEKFDLIKTKLNGEITTFHKGLIRWTDNNPLVKKLNSDWSLLTLKKSLNSTKNHFHRLSYAQLSPEQREKIIEKLMELTDEVARLHQFSQHKYPSNKLVPLSLVVACAGSGFFDSE